MIEVADRLKGTKEYYFSKKLREIATMNANGADVINLGIGSPDMAPPQAVVETLSHWAQKPNIHGYQSYKGLPELRKAFSEWYLNKYHVTLDPETEILPLIGSKEGIVHISMTYLQEGAEVLVPNPGYPAYAAAAKLAGAQARFYNLYEDNGWLPDFEALENTDLSKVKIMWVNYPNMPTGTKASRPLYDKLATFGEKHKILICNDNPYSFVLNDKPISFLSSGLSPFVLELNSLSKSHNMAGWRMGVVAAQEEHIQNILTFKSNVDSGMFLPIQKAAIKALEQSNNWSENLNSTYKSRRKVVFTIMEKLGCTYDEQQVGMFVWARVPNHIEEVEAWADQILYNSKVFITPGFIFGTNGSRYIRISLCNNEQILNKALQRINSK